MLVSQYLLLLFTVSQIKISAAEKQVELNLDFYYDPPCHSLPGGGAAGKAALGSTLPPARSYLMGNRGWASFASDYLPYGKPLIQPYGNIP